MKLTLLSLYMIFVVPSILAQTMSGTSCVCDLKDSEPPFPMEKLQNVEKAATKCTESITSKQMLEVDALLLGLNRRLSQLEQQVGVLEREDDGDLYGAVSLRIIEIELAEILQLVKKLNNTTLHHQSLSSNTLKELQAMTAEMEELEKFDHTRVVSKQRENQRLKRELTECRDELQATPLPPTPEPGHCPQGHLVNVTGPKTNTGTEYGTSYSYGAWGQDANPPAGKENWFWLVALTSSNVYANYIREYSSLSSLIAAVKVGDVVIASANPTTNTIQGPNVVMYGDALYYGCYNSHSICRFNMTQRAVTTVSLPKDSGFNNKFPFCHLQACYVYTDLDLATDESGVWVTYTSPDSFGNVIIRKVEAGSPPALGRTWNTSLHKRTATNTFMACGVLYATRYLDKETEEIFYSFDTVTGQERYDLHIHIKKPYTNIQSLNYSPRDRMLYVYSDAYLLTYNVIFE
ncbi:olfactomedin-4-like [Chanos chanos]|uniref:Olfactomedin-4-like n=1 Tax=Chanos chanos TaxID=29144 RepID=A0A6J2VER8_CHACN|nr:olfactomedin-4-like [Chanos chanos]